MENIDLTGQPVTLHRFPQHVEVPPYAVAESSGFYGFMQFFDVAIHCY
jgi:hypothetical protein